MPKRPFPPEEVTTKPCYQNPTPFLDFCSNMDAGYFSGDTERKASCNECSTFGITGDIE